MNRRELMKGVGVVSLGLAAGVATAEAPINPQMRLYEVDGRTIFPEVNLIGAYVSRVVAFPLVETEDSLLIYGYRASLQHYLAARDEYKIRIHHDAMAMFSKALSDGTKVVDRAEGDFMPGEGEIYRFPKRSHS